MVRATKDWIDRFEERMESVEHVVGHISDILNPYSRRLHDIPLLKEARSRSLGAWKCSSYAKVLELSLFNGTRKVKNLENFLKDVD